TEKPCVTLRARNAVGPMAKSVAVIMGSACISKKRVEGTDEGNYPVVQPNFCVCEMARSNRALDKTTLVAILPVKGLIFGGASDSQADRHTTCRTQDETEDARKCRYHCGITVTAVPYSFVSK